MDFDKVLRLCQKLAHESKQLEGTIKETLKVLNYPKCSGCGEFEALKDDHLCAFCKVVEDKDLSTLPAWATAPLKGCRCTGDHCVC